jgi:type IV secretion system protein VirD4
MTTKTKKKLALLVLLLLIVVLLFWLAGFAFTTVYVLNEYQAEATATASAGVVRATATASKPKKPALHMTPTVRTAPIRQLPLSASQEQALKTFFSSNVFLDILGAAFLLLGGALLVLLKPTKNTTEAHGSAHFLTRDELKAAGSLASTSRRELKARRKAFEQGIAPPSKMDLGFYLHRLIVLDEKRQESHALLLAPTGVGKTSRIIVPALLNEFGHRSLFINDTKGELVDLTLGPLSVYHRCLVFAPTDTSSSHHYNPLAHVKTMDDAEALATCLIENTGISREDFWNSAPKLLTAGVVLHLRETKPDAPFSDLIDILCGMDLDEVIRLLTNSPSELTRKVAASAMKNLKRNDRLAGTIMVEMATHLFHFHNPSLRQVTATNDLDFERFIDEPTALFLSIPEGEADRLEPLSACLIMQMMNAIIRRANRSPGKKLPRHVAFYLDELCNAGTIPRFTKRISTVRSRGIAFILAVPDFGQLRDKYGENGLETILANTTTQIIFPGCGLQEARYYSEKSGDTTVATISNTESGRSFGVAAHQTWTQGETRRPLMTADEIHTMGKDELLVFSSNLHPMKVQSTPYYQNAGYLSRVRMPYTQPFGGAPKTPPSPMPSSPPSASASSSQQASPPPKIGAVSSDDDDERHFLRE